MTADNWTFVFAAYALAVVVLVAYWRFLVRREKELQDAGLVRQQLEKGSSISAAPVSGHPGSRPASRPPLQ